MATRAIEAGGVTAKAYIDAFKAPIIGMP